MKEIDIYDFDKTVVPFDSGSLFWGYSILHYPWIILFIPFQALLAILMVLKVIDFTKFKKYFFCFVMLIPRAHAFPAHRRCAHTHPRRAYSAFCTARMTQT